MEIFNLLVHRADQHLGALEDLFGTQRASSWNSGWETGPLALSCPEVQSDEKPRTLGEGRINEDKYTPQGRLPTETDFTRS
jgi:hypothetical protein